ncbi:MULTISPECIES: long-chain-fatty-acid--CoA ligase [Bacillus]|uniref:long-chain-fatty-acid--CoA ligase n=1 Tax=Bacillus TaxID=1386 RepID=UPI000402CFEE|nr:MULTISPECIES: long-chain-fatty-acid--CoA ligase [Bacillus]QHZ47973.1 long-chain-fatty-acid--CoA ligase [Bacillus sp. NSP9.1]
MPTEKPWLLHYPEQIPHDLEFHDQTLQSILQQSAQQFSEKTAIHFLGKKRSYRQVYEEALKMADYLWSLGMKKGDRVSIMLPNCPQAVIAYYGVLFSGGIIVQTNPLYTERELEHLLQDSGAEIIITLDVLYPAAHKMKALTNLKHIIATSIKEYLPFPKNLLYPFVQKKQNQMTVEIFENDTTHLFRTIMKRPAPDDPPAIDIDPAHDIAVLQYTGGTTGTPKGVMLTHRNILANMEMCAAWFYKLKKGEEKVLGIIPFFHVYGMTAVLNFTIKQGYEMVLLPRFDARTALKTIDREKPTIFPGAPTIYIALLNHPEIHQYDLSSIKCCLSGSAALPVEVKQQFEKVTGGKLVEGYGLSETSPVTHANFIWDLNKAGSIGCPWPGTDAAIYSDDASGFLEPYEHGEIVVKGPQVMKGYWNNDEETAASLRDGWFFTGDIGYMDKDGFFYIVDRKKDVIIAGGFNIYPREIEEVLYEHEAIQEAVVCGIPDEYRGETVKAFVVLKDHATITEKELDEYARSRLAPYKVPKVYEFRDELPKTAVGKILRRALVHEEKANV